MTDGAELLATKYCESEIAFAVMGRDIKCAGHKFCMIGRPYEHGQYIGAPALQRWQREAGRLAAVRQWAHCCAWPAAAGQLAGCEPANP
jgi:hypothetical protein